MHNQLIEHQEKYEIIFDYQSGFRSKHSVNACLAHLSNQILEGFEAIKSTGMILIDHKKAFDTLAHLILLKKLKHIGISPETVRFESYLENRNRIVSLEKSLPESAVLNCGVHQGSILGPILFTLHVNDVKPTLTDCDFKLHADDTCVLFCNQNVS